MTPMIAGNPGVKIIQYTTVRDLKEKIKSEIAKKMQ